MRRNMIVALGCAAALLLISSGKASAQVVSPATPYPAPVVVAPSYPYVYPATVAPGAYYAPYYGGGVYAGRYYGARYYGGRYYGARYYGGRVGYGVRGGFRGFRR
jgi:hypothetical protein